MFDHVTIRVRDRDASERFYDTVLAVLGIDRTYRTRSFSEWRDFSLAPADDQHPLTRGLHLAFVASTPERVQEFWQAGVDAGYESDGEPGPRPQYGPDYYGGFLLDPDGNSAEAVTHDTPRTSMIDHLWIRVGDVAAAKRFYETIAPHAGIRLNDDTPDRAQFVGKSGSFSLVSGTPTENVHMAFPTTDDADVRGFHAAATGAGYRSFGEPGERAHYHRGYYAAYVLDADGNNIEVVNHNRR
jgi:catechol 2,3-dioxygenase-like lactoylglutathione lyase family enzyme